MKVVGYVDQHDEKWIRVRFRGKWAFGRQEDLFGERASFFKELGRQDVAILESALQTTLISKAQNAVFEKKAYVVDRFGWHEGRYVKPGAKLPDQLNDARVIDNRPRVDANWGTSGSAKAWREGIKRFAERQTLPSFVLGCAFASIIQHLVPEIDDNIGFELFHGTSIGKSRLLLLAASVFGPPQQFRRSWHTTVDAVEQTMALRGDSLLLLDELNHFLDSRPNANREVGLVVHNLAAGSEKARHDEPAAKNYRLTFLSSSNVPVGEVVKTIGPNRIEAVQVRMPTIPADAGAGLGVFDSIPPDCTDSAHAVNELTLFVQANYGWQVRSSSAGLRDG
jgi:uncharacterized protein (DUF927 family)